MIEFEVIRWMNFLSTGNQFTEVKLNKSNTTLIIGANGSGKSTLIDALTYCLYGKPLRNINKPNLLNSITSKNMLVEVEFSIDKTHFKVRRGMKPGVFEIFKNGKMLEQNAAMKDYQEQLEKNILKMSFRTFVQIVILGSSNYIPFMRLSKGDRRNIVEDLLGIQIFSTMNTLLKDKLNTNKNELKDLEFKIELVKQKIESSKKQVKVLKQNNEELIASKENLIQKIRDDILTAQEKISKLTDKADLLLSESPDGESVKSKKKKILDLESDIENRKSRLNKELKFFNEHDVCPTCKQDLDEEWKQRSILRREKKKLELDTALSQIEEKLKEVDNKLLELDVFTKKFQDLTSEIAGHNLDIRSWNKSIETLQREIDLIKSNTTQIEVSQSDVNKHIEDLTSYKETKKDLITNRDIMDISSSLLKDGGIKTRIIKQYIPIINKIINKYLASLDFFVNFELDEEFNEIIKSRYRDEFSYGNFSEGEKCRLDLSILFAWRAVAKMRNNASTNLLIMDEILDAVLDVNGVDELLKILGTLEGSNVFVISHRGNEIYDKFHSVIEFKKTNNFSRIV